MAKFNFTSALWYGINKEEKHPTKEVSYMSLGDKIRNRRNQLGMTQDDLAMALKVKRQTIHKYESGITTNLPLGRVQELADALDVSPAYLMGWNEKKPADSEWNSELEKENFRLFKALNPDQQREVLNYQRFLIDKSKNS